MSLTDKDFRPLRKLHKLFNRNNVKISYSCLPNIKLITNAHNRKTLYPSSTIGRKTCNCINIPQCPLQQKCLSNNILYQANITPIGENSETRVYYETKFKLKFENHKKSFNHRNCKSDTELSNEFWKISGKKRSANITWEILGRHQAYNLTSIRFSLCLNVKLKIALHRNNNMVNKRTEILKKYSRISCKVSTKRFTENYCFQESGWLLFPGSSPDYWTHGFLVKAFRENFNVKS